MDTSGFSHIGRYGTISLMKRQEPNSAVTAFGIDNEEITFGRDPQCSVRLYYPDVSPVHCKIVFEERKAFLIVLGASGLLVDGCKVFPHSGATGQTNMMALGNNSDIEIHSKRFRFSYPPKDMRAQLFATPLRPSRRELRLSMITSAQVFSPRPSHDPKENLRVLRSPLKPFTNVSRSLFSVTKPAVHDEEVVLVQGSHPRVVEEDKDLVILEHVDVPPPRMKTPSRPRPSLHKLVLLKSAQRAVVQAETEKQEEEEELEVLGTVIADLGSSSEDEVDDFEDDLSEKQEEQPRQTLTWKKSLESLWPFKSSDDQDDVKEEEEEPQALATPPRQTTYTGNPFMTPQVRTGPSVAAPRFSLGGGGAARRVVVDQPWKVGDLVLPSQAAPSPSRPSASLAPRTTSRETLTQAERKAIQERRRSALKMSDNIFAGGAPGMSPIKTRVYSPEKVSRIEEDVKDSDEEQDVDSLDTRTLLERMKQTAEGIKGRHSIMPSAISPPDLEMAQQPVSAAEITPIAVSHPATPTPSPKKAPTRQTNLPIPSYDTPSLADDEASPDPIGRAAAAEAEDIEPAKPRKGRILRGQAGRLAAETAPTVEKVAADEIAPTLPARSTRKKVTAVAVESKAAPVRASRRRKATPEEHDASEPVVAPATRTRRAASEMEESAAHQNQSKIPVPSRPATPVESDVTVPDIPKKGRVVAKSRSKTVKVEPSDVSDVPAPTTRAKRGKKAVVEEQEESDLIDGKENTHQSEEEPIVKTTRRTKATATAKREVVTEPEVQPRRVTRARTRT